MRLYLHALAFALSSCSSNIAKTEPLYADISLPQSLPIIVLPQSPPSPRPIPQYSTAGLLGIISSTKNCQDFKGAGKELVERMKREERKELFLGLHGHVYMRDEEKESTLEDYVSRSSFPFILEGKSSYLSPILEDVPQDLKEYLFSSDI